MKNNKILGAAALSLAFIFVCGFAGPTALARYRPNQGCNCTYPYNTYNQYAPYTSYGAYNNYTTPSYSYYNYQPAYSTPSYTPYYGGYAGVNFGPTASYGVSFAPTAYYPQNQYYGGYADNYYSNGYDNSYYYGY